LEKRFDRSFFERFTPDVAKELLGTLLVRRVGRRMLSVRIVEAEAYRGEDDPASHAYKGLTKRTAVMFGEGGHAYVYLSYGANRCLNVTTERKGTPGAVLIRAVEPLDGIDLMKRRRGVTELTELTSGPGKLTRAMNIDLALNG
jgi:DNA-3-methyladenine glycosylase